MRLLLDAHISGRVVGRSLSELGHDVRAMDSEQELEGTPDRGVLELAVSEGRILVTIDVGDFLPLIAQLAASGRSHAGLICVPKSISNEEFGALIFAIKSALEEAVQQEEWMDRVVWARRP